MRIEITVCAWRKKLAPSLIIYLHLIYTLTHTVRFVSHTMEMNECAADSHQPAAAQYPRNGRKQHTWRDCREGGNNDCNTAQLGAGSKYISNHHFLPCAPDRSAPRFRNYWSSSDTQPDCTWPFGATSMCCVSLSAEGFDLGASHWARGVFSCFDPLVWNSVKRVSDRKVRGCWRPYVSV